MEKTITIECNGPVEILENLKFLGFIEEYSRLKTKDFMFEVKFKTQTPEFKVGMRAEYKHTSSIWLNQKYLNDFTLNMIYRIVGYNNGIYYLINNKGIGVNVEEKEMFIFFKPYEKPKEGDNIFLISPSMHHSIAYTQYYGQKEIDDLWNLGLAFKTKEQAEFARERLSKLF